MKTDTVQIVDLGRGPQLATKKITVQDVFPFYKQRASVDEIGRWIPALTEEEIAAIFEYIAGHYDEVLQTEKETKAYHDRLRAMQPAWTRANDHLSVEERKALLKKKLLDRKNGQASDHSGG